MAYPYYQYQQPNTGTSSLIWVTGRAGAQSYPIAPNSTVALFDSDAQVIYLKSADMTGMPSIKTLDYTIREIPSQSNEKAPETLFATKEDISMLQEEISEIKEKLKHGKPSVQHDRKSADK